MERNKIVNDQIGGNFFYLPCDITHYTKKKYFTKEVKRFPGVNHAISLIGETDESNLGGKGYYQDGYVQLFNGKDYINITNLGIVDSIYKSNKIFKCTTNQCDVINTKNKNVINSYYHNQTFTIKWGQSITPTNSYIEEDKITKDVSSDFLMDEFIEIKPSNKSAEEQNKGGNFISSPNGTIFYIEGVSQDFLDILDQKKIKSFS